VQTRFTWSKENKFESEARRRIIRTKKQQRKRERKRENERRVVKGKRKKGVGGW